MNKDNAIHDAYKIAISARNFHFSNFNKWMIYYYVAVAAIFVAFYTIKTDDNSLKVSLVLLGFIVSVLWHLSCKGYYFWIKNWAYQIKRFEENIKNENKVYSVFSNHVKRKENNLFNPIQSANISTSKLTLILSFIVSIIWGYFVVNYLLILFNTIDLNFFLIVLVSIIGTYVLIAIVGLLMTSDLKKHELN